MPPDANAPVKPRKPTFRETIKELWGPYQQLLPYLRPYKWRFIAGLASGAAAGVVNGTLALVIQHVTAQVFPNGHTRSAETFATILQHSKSAGDAIAQAAPSSNITIQSVMWTCALIPGVMVLRGVLAYLNAYCVDWVALKLLTDLRNDLFRRLVNQSMAFYNKAQSGQLISQVINDAQVAQGALTQISSDVIQQPFTIVAGMIALLYLDWKFTLVSFVLFPVCLVPITVFGKKVRRQGRDAEQNTGHLMTILHEAFSGIRVVKALAREDFEVREFAAAGDVQFRVSIRVRKAIEIVGPLIEAIAAVGVGMALVYVWVLGITADKFLGLMGGLFILYDPVKRLSRVHVMIQQALASTDRIFGLMAQPMAVEDSPSAITLPRSAGALALENVSYGYRDDRAPAVQEFTLNIEAGKSYALVGASGAGKSTVLSLIMRFYDPTCGVVRMDGHDVRTVSQQSLRQNIAIVNQDTFLFHTSIMENIRYGRLDATDAEVEEAAKQAFAHDFIMAQPRQYGTVIGDKGCNLSGGQQQRVAIARALLKNAPILLLDEATSALDSESEQKIQIALDRLAQGRTVLAIAHRLSTILKADVIVAMDQGRIVEMGSHSELFAKNGHYRRLYDLQFNRREADALLA